MGRRRPGVPRPDVLLGPHDRRPPQPPRGGGRRPAPGPGRLPQRPRPDHGRARASCSSTSSRPPSGPCSPRTAPTPPPRPSWSPAPPPAAPRSSSPTAPTTAPTRGAPRAFPGVTPNQRADTIEFTYNDLQDAERAAAEAGDDVAAILVTPFKHDSFEDQELAEADFARGVRALADRLGAALVIDEVRAGFRLDLRGTWESFGVRPDLSAWSKAMGNGHPIAGRHRRRRAQERGSDPLFDRILLVLLGRDGGREGHDRDPPRVRRAGA